MRGGMGKSTKLNHFSMCCPMARALYQITTPHNLYVRLDSAWRLPMILAQVLPALLPEGGARSPADVEGAIRAIVGSRQRGG